MLHELVHNVQGPHDAVFYKLLDEITEVSEHPHRAAVHYHEAESTHASYSAIDPCLTHSLAHSLTRSLSGELLACPRHCPANFLTNYLHGPERPHYCQPGLC